MSIWGRVVRTIGRLDVWSPVGRVVGKVANLSGAPTASFLKIGAEYQV